jgi:N-acetylmuramoyl-L-alanine amidase
MYKVTESLITMNRPRTILIPQGVVIHSTANPGATAKGHIGYFNNKYRGASAHYFVDWQDIYRAIPEAEQAWHAGPTANGRYLSIEMCETTDQALFIEVWLRTIWLVSDMCRRYGWSANSIISHAEISRLYKETDHTDPTGYLNNFGKTFADLRAAVITKLATTQQHQVNRDTVCQGSKGENVRYLQGKLGITADGDFGPITKAAVIAFQRASGLEPDGIAGPLTWAKIG